MMFINRGVFVLSINQKGSVTAISLFFVIFLGIIFAGVLPLIGTEYRAQTTNRNVVQAQFAADAGAKRALEMFYKTTPTFENWIDISTTSSTLTYVDPSNQTAPNSSGSYHVLILDNNSILFYHLLRFRLALIWLNPLGP